MQQSNIIPLHPRRLHPRDEPESLRSTGLVADLLLAIEAAPWAEPRIWIVRPPFGPPVVVVAVSGLRFALSPDEARLAASALLTDGSPGVASDAARLRQAAAAADARPACGGPLNPVTADPVDEDGDGRRSDHVTGRGATLALGLLLLIALAAPLIVGGRW